MKDLKEPCKSMLATGRCLGCNRLELGDFEGDPNCIYIKIELGEQMKI